jgi:hypothetical protein
LTYIHLHKTSFPNSKIVSRITLSRYVFASNYRDKKVNNQEGAMRIHSCKVPFQSGEKYSCATFYPHAGTISGPPMLSIGEFDLGGAYPACVSSSCCQGVAALGATDQVKVLKIHVHLNEPATKDGVVVVNAFVEGALVMSSQAGKKCSVGALG